MVEIVRDAYYMILLHKDRLKEINLQTLNRLMYLVQAESLLEYEEGFYPRSFTVNLTRYNKS